MTDTYEQATVEQCLRVLGAARAFLPADTGFAHACIALRRIGNPIGADRQRRAYRMLERYRDQLMDGGIDYDAVAVPDGSAPPPPIAPPEEAAIPHGAVRIFIDPGGRLVARTPYELRSVMSDIPGGRYGGKGTGLWVFAATPAGADTLVERLAPYGVTYDEKVTELVAKAHRIREAAAHKSAEELPPIPVSKTDAWLHQRQAFWFASELPAAMLDCEMGTGKSKMIVDLIVNSGAERSLIVCPDRVVGVWPKQFLIHAGREVHVIDPRRENRNGEWKALPIKDRVALYDDALHECRCGLPHVVLSNYAASAHEPFKSWSLQQRWDYVAYDEAHKLKAGGGVWSRWAWRMVKASERRLGGTGTLMPQGPLDVYGEYRALDPGIFGTNEASFKKRYAVMGGYEGREVIDYQREDELAERIASITYQVGAEVLDLPDEVPDVRLTTQLEPKAYRVYREVENEMFAEVLTYAAEHDLEVEDAITADNVLVKILRLQQITGGAVRLDSGDTMEISTAKENLLREHLEDLPAREPVIVFARFHHDLDAIERTAQKLGRPYAELSGRRSDALAHDATLPEHVVIAGVQLQSGGTGIDYTRSAYAIYYSLGYSLGDYLQSRRRLARPGQIRSVRFHHLVIEGTIDEEVYEALEARESVTKRVAAKVRRIQQGM